MKYQGRTAGFWERICESLLDNLSFEGILTFVINISIILAIIHYVVIPLTGQLFQDIDAASNREATANQEYALVE